MSIEDKSEAFQAQLDALGEQLELLRQTMVRMETRMCKFIAHQGAGHLLVNNERDHKNDERNEG